MDFESIEDGIIAELKSKLPYVRSVEPYAGQLEADIEKLPISFPAIFVAYGESALEWVDGPNFNEVPRFSVLVAAKNLKGNKAVRKDDGGCYQMIKDVLKTLTNNKLNLEMEKLQPVRVSLVFISKSIAIYGVDFQTNFDTTY